MSQLVVGKAEEISTYSWSRVCTVNCRVPTNGKQLPAFPLEVGEGTKPRFQRWEVRVHSATMAPDLTLKKGSKAKSDHLKKIHSILFPIGWLKIVNL